MGTLTDEEKAALKNQEYMASLSRVISHDQARGVRDGCGRDGIFTVGKAEREWDNAAYISAACNFFRDHGQHFAGLEQRLAEAEEMLAWFANNPYAYRIMADKCSEAAAFLAAKG